MSVLVVHLYPRESECIVCNAPLVSPRQGVPMYEGDVLPNDWTGEWGGFDACEPCYRVQSTLTAPTPTRRVAEIARRLTHASVVHTLTPGESDVRP